MAGRNRKKKQGCVDGSQFLSPKKEDPWTLVRKLEARLAQEKFYHEKTKTESQYEVKTVQARIKSLERQRKTLLEKLEQNPIEQQTKLEKELNEISRQLRETAQKLAAAQQVIDRLTRSNRGLKKAKEKLDERFEKEMELKNTLIQRLEEQILAARKPSKEEKKALFECHPKENLSSDMFTTTAVIERVEDQEWWEPTEMWDKSGDEKDQAEREEKRQTKDTKKMVDSTNLEVKTVIKEEEGKITFFPSMYEGSGYQKCKEKPLTARGFDNLPVTTKENSNSEQVCLSNQAERPNEEDGAQTQRSKASLNEALPNLNRQDHKEPARLLKCWNKARKENMARNFAQTQSDEGINLIKYFRSRLLTGSKIEAAQDTPDASANREAYKAVPRPPPPGFETNGAGFAVLIGMNGSKHAHVAPAGN